MQAGAAVRASDARTRCSRKAHVRAQAELRNSVAAWFYEDGELAQDLFKGDVLRLLATFERSRPKRA